MSNILLLQLINKCSFFHPVAPNVCTLKQTSVTQALFLFLPHQLRSDLQSLEPLVQTEDVSAASSSPPPFSPARSSESPVSPTSPTEAAADSTETSSVKSRRRSGRPRPRPISDYAQLVSRKHLIPEEAAEQYDKERTPDTLHDVCGDDRNGTSSENCSMNGDVQRHRPISVIGAVDLFPADSELEDDCLPSVSFTCFNFPYILF